MRSKEKSNAASNEPVEKAVDSDITDNPELEQLIGLLKGMKESGSVLPGHLRDEIDILLEFMPAFSHYVQGEARGHQLYLISALRGIADALDKHIDFSKLEDDDAKKLKSFLAIADRVYNELDKEHLIAPCHKAFCERIFSMVADPLTDPTERSLDFKDDVREQWETLFSNITF